MTVEHHTGQCLCGAIRYEIDGPLSGVHLCHCGQCRRQSGHATAATGAARDTVVVHDDDGALVWYRSSEIARRGFCRHCGSNLFWDDGGEEFSLNAGSLDSPTGLRLNAHIYVDDKGDYYEIDDDLPKFSDAETPMTEDR